MNILITGIAGLLGSRLADYLLENNTNIKIIGIDDFSGGYIENINKNVILYNRCIGKSDIEDIFIENDIDYVFHFAAYAAECLSPFIRKYNYENNLVTTADIVNNCIKYNIKRLIFTSSIAVYGNQNPPFNELLTPSPIDPYGVSKYACELDIKIAGDQHGLDWCILRPHNVYGAKQNIWDKYRNVLGIWMYQYLNDQPMTIFGDGSQTRAFSLIDDSLSAFWNAAILPEASKQIINIVGKTHTSIKEACEIVKKVIGGGTIIHKEARHEVKNAYVTWKKSVDILDYQEKFNIEEGVTLMWKWAKEQPKRNQFQWEKYELNNGLYSYWKIK
jgi:UDP-glucose 4-epimerase